MGGGRCGEGEGRGTQALEGADDCLLSSSGMNSATTMLLALVPAGGHIVTTTDCYRRTRQFIQTVRRLRLHRPTLHPHGKLVLQLCRGPRPKMLAGLSHAACTSVWLVDNSGWWICDGSGERVGRCCRRWESQRRCWTPRTWGPWSAC